MNLVEELKKIVKGDVLVDEETLSTYSKDASIFEVKPQVVVFPKDVDDVKSVVDFVNKNKKTHHELSITGRSGGTDMTGGPLTQSILLVFTKYINQIIKIGSDHAVVQPGLYYRDLEKEALKKGLMYPSYPASKSICALGGIIANNSGGEKTLTYGKTQDHVRSVKLVLSDGKQYEFKPLKKKELDAKMKKKDFEGHIYKEMYKLIEHNYDHIQQARPHVSKNSAGYNIWDVWDREKEVFDLTKLFVGCQGTLGLWMEADVDMVKKHKHARLLSCTLKNVDQMVELVNTVIPLKPETLETFDKKTLMLAIKFMPDMAKVMKSGFLKLLFSFRREAIKTLFHGIPEFIVLVEMTADSKEELDLKVKEAHKLLKKNKIPHIVMKSEQEGEKYWTMRRQSFNLLRNKVKDKRATPFIDDFCILPEKMPEFLPKLNAILDEHGITPTLAGHAGSGNFHIIPLMDLTKKEVRDKIPIVSDKVYDLVVEYGGSITAEHNDGMIRTAYLGKMFSPHMLHLFNEVKRIFDPHGVFNPGKKVHPDWQYAMDHIKTYLDK